MLGKDILSDDLFERKRGREGVFLISCKRWKTVFRVCGCRNAGSMDTVALGLKGLICGEMEAWVDGIAFWRFVGEDGTGLSRGSVCDSLVTTKDFSRDGLAPRVWLCNVMKDCLTSALSREQLASDA